MTIIEASLMTAGLTAAMAISGAAFAGSHSGKLIAFIS